ncbi:MAG: PQQ-dependent sugar dehydrogenase [Candidatus Levybacteria bacterium]|nr:PQQ-dependent sugar dehydrogenase [Candidatus Levybacteria bacterium]
MQRLYNTYVSSKLIIALLLILLTIGLLFSAQAPSPTNAPAEKITIIAKSLEVPWALAFLPDGNLLVTERKGSVKGIDIKTQDVKNIAQIQVKQTGESGLHGIAVHPDFPQKKYIYLYYTYSSNGSNTLNKVSRFDFSEEKLNNEKVIVDAIPGAIFHDGGRIKFGPDNFLYITTGDAQNPSLAQDKNSLAGKILRVGEDEKVEVYSYGHRNPQGITWDDKGNLWETEHGSSACDEINRIDKNNNYGWPTVRCDQTQNGMVPPLLQSGSDTWAPAGAAIINDTLYFGGLRGSALYSLDIKPDFRMIVIEKKIIEHFKGEFGRIRDVVLGPDNMLYITTSNRDGRGTPTSDDDKIIRVNPQEL